MAQVQDQLDKHESGVKPLDDQRLKSLQKRLHSYKGQIYDYSKRLSDEVGSTGVCGVCVCMCVRVPESLLWINSLLRKLNFDHLSFNLIALVLFEKEIDTLLDKHSMLAGEL